MLDLPDATGAELLEPLFMSLNGTVLRLGQTLGPLIMTAVDAAGGFGVVYSAGAMLAVALAALTAAGV